MTQTAQPGPAPSPTAKRNWFLRHWFISLLALGVGSCAFMIRDRSVSWEEEVLLNTGETIVVKRRGTYEYRYSAGDGFVGYSPNWRSTIEFTYKGQKYRHIDDVGLMLLAISPEGIPNLVTLPNTEWAWRNNYYCVTPYYVQFLPDKSGSNWTWPEKIEPWLYNMTSNLMFGLISIEEDSKKISNVERNQRNAKSYQDTEYRIIDPSYSSINTCPRRK